MYVSPSLYCCSFGGTIRPSTPACEQTKYMSFSVSNEDGGQLSPPTAALATTFITFGSLLIGVKSGTPTTFGSGFCPATPSAAFFTAAGFGCCTGLNGSIVGSGWVGHVFCDGSCGTFTSGIG